MMPGMPNNSRQLVTSNGGSEWDSLMEVHHEPIEKNYELLEEIGKGQFAIVRKCMEINTGSLYAAKIMRKRRVARGVAAADIAREAGLLARLRHPNIVSLHKVIDTGTTVVLLLELISGGELFHWTPSGEVEAAHVVRQVLMALSHLHSHQVAHLDIKPENILLSSPPPMPSIKLIDLGLSHRLIPGSEHRALFGTPEFVAPEIVNYEPLSLGTDLWAVGVLTYILLSGASPFLGEDKQETYANVAACQYQFDNEYFSTVSEIAKDFIRSLLIKDPKERGSAESCLKHPWILTESEASNGLGGAMISAVKRGCVEAVSQLLLQGAPLNMKDSKEDTLLHIACEAGDEGMVTLLIENGIDLDTPNKKGLTPLHVAARHGHINVVRHLCLAGCDVDKTNRGIRADVTAIKYGYPDIANLLDKLRIPSQRENYIRQLQPTHRPIDRLHIRLLGHCASGKSSLISSLKSGIFSFGFFRRSRSQNYSAKNNFIQREPSIELDVTSKHGSLSFEYSDSEYEGTQGVEWSRGNVGGECVFWELCGREEYLASYHYVLTFQQPAVHLITVSLREPLTVQLQQIKFWLRFIVDRITPNSIGFAGKCSDIKVILVGTYAPEPLAPNSSGGSLLSPLLPFLKDFTLILGDEPQMVAVDATNPSSPGLKLLRSYLNNARMEFLEDGPEVAESFLRRDTPREAAMYVPLANLDKQSALVWTGLAESWRTYVQSLEVPPVMLTQDEFLNEIRKINPLVCLEHSKQLGLQLQNLGECLLLPGDLIVLSPEWFWQDVINWQLSPDQRGRLGGRTTGVYTLEDFQARCPCPASQALQALQAVNLCVPCEVDDDEVEYELPCLNLVERLPGLWEPWKSSTNSLPHAGLRLCPAEAPLYHLSPIFPHLQAQLRKITQTWDPSNSDLYQWWRGSKLCVGPCESIVTFEEEEQSCIEIRVRGPRGSSAQCFGLFSVILDAVNATLDLVAPGMLLEKHWLSPSQLQGYSDVIHSWEPATIVSALIDKNLEEAILKNPINNQEESIWDIVGCGLPLMENCLPGTRQPLKSIKPAVKRRLAEMLDPPDHHGRDWCLLAVRLGLGDRVAQLDSTVDSPTLRLLNCTGTDCTVSSLIQQLRALDRGDAVHLLLSHTPVYVLSMAIDSETGSNLSR
ncbi:death-associated protein kinase 1-like isoform X1 [Vespa velutina]|uniref:death-associated protein kinase 1-like isoform X1 n=1 Tax=Vespa velutina TaxID=202808 RepID=UPI001FB3BB9D|nr:death-associated protein kinase 1-like isoform X1 [Vespa velutina]XP_047353840.1 death-associated protein kinase 1-like isoform X1 [Vespa velutina]XP_047353841.1 death-associated protein kinase 1-like isoform X1 [Vespa velutina]XP_047353842.1 death-associated protein kinase 1-like isoform X1 [Vespa velutina]XP_047353843.1 death-associated protein kinase 1-like isoform X1 [Vespa velutina]XP_047353844.1 death-associated protein kinase 1-like isoform X1 [Vespa velutina]